MTDVITIHTVHRLEIEPGRAKQLDQILAWLELERDKLDPGIAMMAPAEVTEAIQFWRMTAQQAATAIEAEITRFGALGMLINWLDIELQFLSTETIDLNQAQVQEALDYWDEALEGTPEPSATT